MKKYILLFLAILLTLTLFSCKQEESTATTEASAPERMTTCAISYPTLIEGGGVQMSSNMEDYPVGTMYQALEEGLNGKTEVTFNEDGTIASIGELKAENGNRFIISTISSKGQRTDIGEKPAEITLEDNVSYEIYYADKDGVKIESLNAAAG